MEAIRRYVLSIICAAIVCGILSDLAGKSFFQKQMKLACSVFLAFVFLKPLVNGSLPELIQNNSYLISAEEAAAQGESIRIRSLASIIKQEAEAYVLKEAKSVGADITVQIALDYGNPPTPNAATIYGSFDASSETHLSRILSEELGIPKEHQTWIRQDSYASNNLLPNIPMSS